MVLEYDVVDKLKEDAVRDYLKYLISRLDELDEEDFFGSSGWRYFLGIEDK